MICIEPVSSDPTFTFLQVCDHFSGHRGAFVDQVDWSDEYYTGMYCTCSGWITKIYNQLGVIRLKKVWTFCLPWKIGNSNTGDLAFDHDKATSKAYWEMHNI